MRNLVLIGTGAVALAFAPLAAAIGATNTIHASTPPAATPTTAVTSAYAGTKAAQAAKKAGDKAKQAGKYGDAMAAYKKAITLDPKYAAAQMAYVRGRASKYSFKLFRQATTMAKMKAMQQQLEVAGKKDKAISKEMLAEYRVLATQHPHNAVYPWILGQWAQGAKQGAYCEQAVQIDPNFGRGWECLAQLAVVQVHPKKVVAYYNRAMQALPKDAQIAGWYGYFLAELRQNKTAEFDRLAKRFPKSDFVAMDVINSVQYLTSRPARSAALAKMVSDPPGSSEKIKSIAAHNLYQIYMTTDLVQAKNLAHGMATSSKKDKSWTKRDKYVTGLLKAKKEIWDDHPSLALVTLGTVKNLDTSNRWYLLEAKAMDSSGDTAGAVGQLRDRFAQRPSSAVMTALVNYGAKLGRSRATIENMVWTKLRATAKTAHPFTLKRLDNHGSVSLSSYRGKPVIADFWFPYCENCREAFPNLNKVALKFASRGLTVLAINGIKKQQPLAEPYLRGMGYHFVGLAANSKWASKAYGVLGYPTTLFIGPKGKILFDLDLRGYANLHAAEAAVKFILTGTKGVTSA